MLNFVQNLLIFSGKKFKFSKNLSKVLQTIQISKFDFSKNLNFQRKTEEFRKFAVLGSKNENSFQKSVKSWSFELEKFQNFCIFLAENQKKQFQKSLNLT